MAEETIYLCNFRVSAVGDWLCLEELNDIELQYQNISLDEEEDGNDQEDNNIDSYALERANLLNVLKLTIKEILDTSLSYGRMLDDDNNGLQQFFLILEHILKQGLKCKKGIMREKRNAWEVLEKVEQFSSEAKDITLSVRELPNVKTGIGRARAWVRLALMQKKLADYFRILADKKEILNEMYNKGSFMLEEECSILCGLLVGLNVIDFTVSLKDQDLDKPLEMIDFSLYLRENQPVSIHTPMELSQGSKKMAAILDQKNYLEELNKHLSSTVASLQQKVADLQASALLMEEGLVLAENKLSTHQKSLKFQSSEPQPTQSYQNEDFEATKNDNNLNVKINNSTATTSAAWGGTTSSVALGNSVDGTKEESGSLSSNDESESRAKSEYEVFSGVERNLRAQLQEEIILKQRLEKELEDELVSKKEMEIMMRIMEKDLKIRQSSLVLMKKENEALKQANNHLRQQLNQNVNKSGASNK